MGGDVLDTFGRGVMSDDAYIRFQKARRQYEPLRLKYKQLVREKWAPLIHELTNLREELAPLRDEYFASMRALERDEHEEASSLDQKADEYPTDPERLLDLDASSSQPPAQTQQKQSRDHGRRSRKPKGYREAQCLQVLDRSPRPMRSTDVSRIVGVSAPRALYNLGQKGMVTRDTALRYAISETGKRHLSTPAVQALLND